MDGKVAVITGGASGIGRATCIRLAEEGADVVVTDIEEEGGQETVERIEQDGGNAKFHELDVRDYDRFDEILDEEYQENGHIDVLFNNAGVGEDNGFEETSLEHRDRIIDINLKGVWNGCHAVLPYMKESGGGSIVNSSSMAGWMPSDIPSYSMTKAAVLHLTRSIAQELGAYGIRINALCPGTIKSQMTDKWYTEEEHEEMRLHNATNRWGEPEEMADCVLFLASDEASFVTGRGLKADNGYI